MVVVHMVLFQFKEDASPDTVQKISQAMVDLGSNCVHPTSSQTYIKSISGGRNVSKEGFSGGLSHGFVLEFESIEDRDYFVEKDPAHLDFISQLKPHLQLARVLDYTPNDF